MHYMLKRKSKDQAQKVQSKEEDYPHIQEKILLHSHSTYLMYP